MPHKGYIFQKKEIILTEDEKVQYQDYLDAGESTSRYAIWEYVEENEPIPNELKPILLKILQGSFKGKSKADTAAYWDIIVKEILFEIVLNGLKQDAAIEAISKKYNEHVDTVERRYKDGKNRYYKNAVTEAFKGAK